MKYIEITIDHRQIYDRVSLQTAYAGSKTEVDSGFFSRVATEEADISLLKKFYEETWGQAAEILRQFIISCDFGDDRLSLTLALSNGYDSAMTESVKSDLFQGLVAGVTAQWYELTFPDRKEAWKLESETLLKRVLSKLCHRRPPQRPL